MYPYEKLFGNTKELRILEYILNNMDDIEFWMSDIARDLEISLPKSNKIFLKFNKYKIILINPDTSKYYINHNSPFVKAFISINTTLIKHITEQELWDEPPGEITYGL